MQLWAVRMMWQYCRVAWLVCHLKNVSEGQEIIFFLSFSRFRNLMKNKYLLDKSCVKSVNYRKALRVVLFDKFKYYMSLAMVMSNVRIIFCKVNLLVDKIK